MKLLSMMSVVLGLSVAQVGYAHDFSVSSQTIKQGKKLENAQVFNNFGCKGSNQSPDIKWENAPKGTKSFAVSMYDPDAPTGSGFWHWSVIDIPADVKSLAADAGNVSGKTLPKGAVQIRNDYGFAGFGGACPPEGDNPHKYQLTVYALNVDKLGAPEGASPALTGFLVRQHAIGQASITGHFMR